MGPSFYQGKAKPSSRIIFMIFFPVQLAVGNSGICLCFEVQIANHCEFTTTLNREK